MERTSRVAVLFARARSIYHQVPGCDVYDKERNALTFGLDCPVVAHPPCAPWSRWLSWASKSGQVKKKFAPWAVEVVRHCGGVLEHPAYSRLWDELRLPRPASSAGELGAVDVDSAGGFSIEVFQGAYGHKAPKKTWLYIVGCSPADLAGLRTGGFRVRYPFKNLSGPQRIATPPAFARFLVRTARLTRWSTSSFRAAA